MSWKPVPITAKVTRVTKIDYDELVKELSESVEYIMVPALSPSNLEIHYMQFRGVFRNKLKKEIVVAWPVNRSLENQQAFAEQVGGQPVSTMAVEFTGPSLTALEGVKP